MRHPFGQLAVLSLSAPFPSQPATQIAAAFDRIAAKIQYNSPAQTTGPTRAMPTITTSPKPSPSATTRPTTAPTVPPRLPPETDIDDGRHNRQRKRSRSAPWDGVGPAAVGHALNPSHRLPGPGVVEAERPRTGCAGTAHRLPLTTELPQRCRASAGAALSCAAMQYRAMSGIDRHTHSHPEKWTVYRRAAGRGSGRPACAIAAVCLLCVLTRTAELVCLGSRAAQARPVPPRSMSRWSRYFAV
jgi:hypothetical protein